MEAARTVPGARPLAVDFLVASSYGVGTVSSGDVRLAYDPCTDLAGKRSIAIPRLGWSTAAA